MNNFISNFKGKKANIYLGWLPANVLFMHELYLGFDELIEQGEFVPDSFGSWVVEIKERDLAHFRSSQEYVYDARRRED